MTPIYAAASGTVVGARWRDGGGRSFWLYHADKWRSYYAHLEWLAISEGERVYRDQLVGFSGNTAKAYVGPHLHYSLMGPDGKWKDPELYLNLTG